MDRNEIYEKLNNVFREVFDDDSIEVNDSTTANDIEDWDSLEHINLMMAVQKAFKIKLSMGQISGMKNVGELVDIIQQQK